MAWLISAATGNFTAATTWKVVDGTSLLDSEAGSTALTTAYVESAAFTPGAITIDGIAVKLAARVASPTGTISVRLADAGVTVTGTEATINVTDLPTAATGAAANEGGWILFTFAASVTLVAAVAYTVSAKCSVANEATLYRDATAGNWARMVRTTTTGAPATGDVLHIIGEHTGAGLGNDFVVTMDSTSTLLDLGSGVNGSTCVTVGKRGTLNFGTALATAYYLRCSGNVILYNGGTLTLGTVANPIPRNSTANLVVDPAADGGVGLIGRNGSTFIAQGLSRTSGKNIVFCKLNTDEPAAETVLGVDTDTGWLAGDEIGIASTTRTYSECEKRTLSVDAGLSSLTVTSGLTYAHSGTAPTQAEVVLLTRNVRIGAVSSTIVSFVNFKPTATVDIDWVGFYWMGENLAGKRGIEVETTTGSFDIQYSSLHDFEDKGIYMVGAVNNINISHNIAYRIATASNLGIYLPVTSGANISICGNVLMFLGASANHGLYLEDFGTPATGNRVVGVYGVGVTLAEKTFSPGTFSDNVIHSCSSAGLNIYKCPHGITFLNNLVWRNNAYGVVVNGYCLEFYDVFFKNMKIFDNLTADVYFQYPSSNVLFEDCEIYGGVSGVCFSSTYTAIYVNHHFINCNLYNHTQDIEVVSESCLNLFLHNTILGSSTEVSNMGNAVRGSFIKSQRHDQLAGLHKSWFREGVISIDAAIRDGTAGASQRLMPLKAAEKLRSGGKKVAVADGSSVTVSVKVRQSVAADGAAYDGARARLILRRNVPMGITADTVLATATVASEGAFETISGATPLVTDNGVLEFVVDCDGTAGWISVDSWSVS